MLMYSFSVLFCFFFSQLSDLYFTADLIKIHIAVLGGNNDIQIAAVIKLQNNDPADLLYEKNAHDLQFIFDLLRKYFISRVQIKLLLIVIRTAENLSVHRMQYNTFSNCLQCLNSIGGRNEKDCRRKLLQSFISYRWEAILKVYINIQCTGCTAAVINAAFFAEWSCDNGAPFQIG